MAHAATRIWLILLLLTLTACGTGDWGGYQHFPPGQVDEAPPEVILLMVSGHTGDGDGLASYSYLDDAFGPALTSAIDDLGYSVKPRYYVDHPSSTDTGGYRELKSDLRWIRDHWMRGWPTRPTVFLLAHSHGGVWATAATRRVPDLPIRVQVAMDHSSRGWGWTLHTRHNDSIGGDPRSVYKDVHATSDCDLIPGDTGDTVMDYDLQDIVFPSVEEYLEIRTTTVYDKRWNIRFDTTTDGLHCWESPDDHEGMYAPGSTTYDYILAFLTDRLPAAR